MALDSVASINFKRSKIKILYEKIKFLTGEPEGSYKALSSFINVHQKISTKN